MQIELIPINEIREYERNPRKLDDHAVLADAKSIEAFGFEVPVIVDGENILVAGHTRIRAARHLGLTEVPAIRADDLTPEQIQAFRIADNKLHELTSWDVDLLLGELEELKELDVDLPSLGFSADELNELFNPGVKEGECDPDDIPAPPDEAITRHGDLWILGNHRLLCGDAGSVEDLDRLLDGQPVHLVNTDPPYNVKVEPRSNNAIAAGLSSFTNKKAQLHHQGFDVARQGPKKATHKQMRAKDRPLENDLAGTRCAVRRCHSSAMGEVHGTQGGAHQCCCWLGIRQGGYLNEAMISVTADRMMTIPMMKSTLMRRLRRNSSAPFSLMYQAVPWCWTKTPRATIRRNIRESRSRSSSRVLAV